MYNDGGLTERTPLMSYQGKEGWRVWSSGKATQVEERDCKGGEKGSDERGGAGARLIQEEFVLRSGRIGWATRLAAKLGPEAVIQKEGRLT